MAMRNMSGVMLCLNKREMYIMKIERIERWLLTSTKLF